MHLMPNAGWWTAAWCRDHEVTISVDICTPPKLTDGEWTYIDLELDPVGLSDGSVEIYDEDQFVAACEAGQISREEAIEARNAATEIERCLRHRTETIWLFGLGKTQRSL